MIGVPQTSFYTQEEINTILEFVRTGGSLLVFHRFGGDVLQKTNLNQLLSHFGVFSENTLVCSKNNIGIKSLPIISSFSENLVMQNLKKLILPGACSLRISRDAHMLCETDEDAWIEMYKPHQFEWINEHPKSRSAIGAYSIYGQGHVIVLGTPDFLNNNEYYGLPSLDNQRFFLNLLKWLTRPVSEVETKDWILQQLGNLSEQMVKINKNMKQMKDLMLSYDKRLRDLEMKFYELNGIHFPKK